jgi:N-acyl-D-amino-acid deacylase
MTAQGRDALFDLVLSGGTVVDGTGQTRRRADVGIVGDQIEAVGDLRGHAARRTLDARGCVVAPGFIDVHVHSEVLLLGRHAGVVAEQGVTTHVVGQDGFGFAPTEPATFDYMRSTLHGTYGAAAQHSAGDVATFLSRFDGRSPVNVATLVPLGCVRMNVLGHAAPTAPTAAEVNAMAAACGDALNAGAVGISSGLDYVPSSHASTEELGALARVAAATGVPYVTHVRYRLGLMEALQEAIVIGESSGADVHISHLLPDSDNDIGADAIIALLDNASTRGVVGHVRHVSLHLRVHDAPVVAPALGARRRPPHDRKPPRDDRTTRRLRHDVDASLDLWSRCTFAGAPAEPFADLVGEGLVAAAQAREMHPADLVAAVLVASNLDGLVLGIPDRSEETAHDLRRLLADDRHLFASDGIYGAGTSHPRGTQAAPTYIREAVRTGMLSLEAAVSHMTSRPAHRFGLERRGVLAPHAFADVTVFDPETYGVDDQGRVTGVRLVLCNGVPVVECGGARARGPATPSVEEATEPGWRTRDATRARPGDRSAGDSTHSRAPRFPDSVGLVLGRDT